ncbi:sodium-dependent nutrient amino acid transporter 1-like [Eriocheir sinensis]|uniref:sodium-dependent nutrient amino acid transporter 1-like n=1 Tax=Eriocheir sinensis TaxID=95602 RepID=UPI0021C7C618|nr:sodium-dependent nutrient amino acid transporter 1-like [Eriocheir sinensis]
MEGEVSPLHAKKQNGLINGVIDNDYGGTDNSNTTEPLERTSETAENLANEARDQWDRPVEFIMACMATSVGLGNVWRFPTAAFDNGGGAFLIPYLIVLTLIGRPLYFLELVIGQFSSSGSIRVWETVPAMKGIGYGQMIATWYVVTYYSFLMGLTVFYLGMSFSDILPWSVCDKDWADENCVDFTSRSLGRSNNSQSSAEQYFFNYVLQLKDDITDGIGLPDWRLVLCLLFSWLLLFLTQAQGIKSSGKVAYFTALFPYVLLVSLMIHGALLPGAVDGMLYFITPQWTRLLDSQVWFAAVTQAFFSLGIGFGTLIHLASYNSFSQNVYRVTWIISIIDTFTSLLAGVTIFAILGNLAHEIDVEIEDVVRSGSGLAFISYPEALARFTFAPQLFSVLFFMMLLTLCVGSIQGLLGSIITVITDECPARWTLLVTIVVCVATFLASLFYTTPGGLWILSLMDYFGGSFIIFVLAIFESATLIYIYGLKKIIQDVKFMLNIDLGFYWKITWGLCPVLLLGIFTYSMVFLDLPTVRDELFPDIAYVCGFFFASLGMAMVPIGFFYSLAHTQGKTVREKFNIMLSPTDKWGPKQEVHKKEWEKIK